MSEAAGKEVGLTEEVVHEDAGPGDREAVALAVAHGHRRGVAVAVRDADVRRVSGRARLHPAVRVSAAREDLVDLRAEARRGVIPIEDRRVPRPQLREGPEDGREASVPRGGTGARLLEGDVIEERQRVGDARPAERRRGVGVDARAVMVDPQRLAEDRSAAPEVAGCEAPTGLLAEGL